MLGVEMELDPGFGGGSRSKNYQAGGESDLIGFLGVSSNSYRKDPASAKKKNNQSYGEINLFDQRGVKSDVNADIDLELSISGYSGVGQPKNNSHIGKSSVSGKDPEGRVKRTQMKKQLEDLKQSRVSNGDASLGESDVKFQHGGQHEHEDSRAVRQALMKKHLVDLKASNLSKSGASGDMDLELESPGKPKLSFADFRKAKGAKDEPKTKSPPKKAQKPMTGFGFDADLGPPNVSLGGGLTNANNSNTLAPPGLVVEHTESIVMKPKKGRGRQPSPGSYNSRNSSVRSGFTNDSFGVGLSGDLPGMSLGMDTGGGAKGKTPTSGFGIGSGVDAKGNLKGPAMHAGGGSKANTISPVIGFGAGYNDEINAPQIDFGRDSKGNVSSDHSIPKIGFNGGYNANVDGPAYGYGGKPKANAKANTKSPDMGFGGGYSVDIHGPDIDYGGKPIGNAKANAKTPDMGFGGSLNLNVPNPSLNMGMSGGGKSRTMRDVPVESFIFDGQGNPSFRIIDDAIVKAPSIDRNFQMGYPNGTSLGSDSKSKANLGFQSLESHYQNSLSKPSNKDTREQIEFDISLPSPSEGFDPQTTGNFAMGMGGNLDYGGSRGTIKKGNFGGDGLEFSPIEIDIDLDIDLEDGFGFDVDAFPRNDSIEMKWKGQFEQKGKLFDMECDHMESNNTGVLEGFGSDAIGDFTIGGRVAKTGVVSFIKKYLNGGQFNYKGKLDNKSKITGEWTFKGKDGEAQPGGKFHLKPDFKEFSGVYEKDGKQVEFDLAMDLFEGQITGGGVDGVGAFSIYGIYTDTEAWFL
jgi:hypothetical protein